MQVEELVHKWFNAWDEGDYMSIPVSDNFKHTSPYRTIGGKSNYLKVVEENKDKFLGNRIQIHDKLYGGQHACVRYTITNQDFRMEVSEWIYTGNELIEKIVSYYNIEGEISDSRKLSGLK
jgi:hypothetical protein